MGDGAPVDEDIPVTAASALTGDVWADPASPFSLYDASGNLIITANVDPSQGPTGLGPPLERFAQLGVYNGDFEALPPSLSEAVADDNVLPHWRFRLVAGPVAVWVVRDASSGSGWSPAVRFQSGDTTDEAYLEQYVDVGSRRAGGFPDQVRATVVAPSGNGGTLRGTLAVQYLDGDGVLIGSETTDTADVAAGATGELLVVAASAIRPTNAKTLRIRVGARRGAAAVTVTGDVVITEVSRTASVSRQEFTTAGSHTWYEPSDAQFVEVVIIGGGGGGGGGRRGAAGTNRYGGGGGGAGAMARALYLASDLASTVTVTLGDGGTAGDDGGASNTNGTNGGAGVSSSFGTYLRAGGGDKGNGGGSTAPAPASTGDGGSGYATGSFPGNDGGDGDGSVGGSSRTGPGGGGGGGFIDSANNVNEGGDGGVPADLDGVVSGGAGGSGAAGTAGAAVGAFGGTGGGGGGASAAGAQSTRRGAAGIRGSGGGGGGACTNGVAAGQGGAGGAGYCLVLAW